MSKVENKPNKKNNKQKPSFVKIIIPLLLIFLGITFLLIKAMTKEYIDKEGILHEKFFLIPIGYLFIFSGIALIFLIINKNKRPR